MNFTTNWTNQPWPPILDEISSGGPPAVQIFTSVPYDQIDCSEKLENKSMRHIQDIRVAICLHFEGVGRQRIEAMAGSISGLERNLNALPHITLYSAQTSDVESMASALVDVCSSVAPLKVNLGGLTILDEKLLCLVVINSLELDDLQSSVVGVLSSLAPPDRDYYAPALWRPHVTLGRLRAGSDWRMAHQIASDQWTAAINEIAVVETRSERRSARLALPTADAL